MIVSTLPRALAFGHSLKNWSFQRVSWREKCFLLIVFALGVAESWRPDPHVAVALEVQSVLCVERERMANNVPY